MLYAISNLVVILLNIQYFSQTKENFNLKQINSVFTLFSMTTPMAVRAVKHMALMIMIAPTAVLVFRAARLTIHPLRWERRDFFKKIGELEKKTINNLIYTWKWKASLQYVWIKLSRQWHLKLVLIMCSHYLYTHWRQAGLTKSLVRWQITFNCHFQIVDILWRLWASYTDGIYTSHWLWRPTTSTWSLEDLIAAYFFHDTDILQQEKHRYDWLIA